jgi:hypothetical protein
MTDCARSACLFRVAVFAGVALALSACGGGSSSSNTAETTASSANQAPDIQGTPPATATAGTAYEFKPTATDPDQDALTFTVSNKPAWASFDTATGRLWGTPAAADAGEYAGIEVAATDGTARDAMTFAITVQPAAKGATSVTLAWSPPTENTDGSTLTNLSGYRIHYGKSSRAYSDVVKLDNPGITRYVVENLQPGTYFFTITAVSANGVESDFSGEAQANVS